MTDPQHARLRLAARTLVEWRTQKTSEYYKSVLDALIDTSAMARHCGLHRGHEILSLDDNGSLLWYLADTLTTDLPSTSKADSEADVQGELELLTEADVQGELELLMADATIGLIERSVEVDEFHNVWIKPFNVGEILDVIYDGIRSEEQRWKYLSMIVLLAIVTPIRYERQRQYAQELLTYHRPVASAIRRIRDRVRRSYDVFSQIMVGVTTILIGGSTAWFVFVFFGSEARLNLFIGRLYDVKSLQELGEVLVTSFSTILVLLNAVTILLAAYARTNKKKITSVINKILLWIIGASRSIREGVRERGFRSTLAEEFGVQCGENPDAWRSGFNAGDEWIGRMLSVTRYATIPVIKAAFRSLESSLATAETKRKIFTWLCRVQIRRDVPQP